MTNDRVKSVNLLLPSDLLAEQYLLAGIFLDNSIFETISGFLSPDDFYNPAHVHLFKIMIKLNEREDVIDPVTVVNQLKSDKSLKKIGGVPYISELADLSPGAVNTINYAKIIKEKAVLRKLILEFRELMEEALKSPEDMDDFIDLIESKIYSITERRNFETFKNLKETLNEVYEAIEQMVNRTGEEDVIKTGFYELDEIIIGLQPANLIVLAARPGKGKTSLALNIAQYAAENETPVLFFSLEMTELQLGYRLLSATAETNLEKLMSGHINKQNELVNVFKALSDLERLSNYIHIDTKSTTLVEIKGNARKKMKELKAKKGLIIVDYLQLMHGSRRFERKDLEIGEISRGLKQLAKDLNSPIIVLSQLNREVEKRDTPKPRFSDLRESGSIEQDADIILFLYDPNEVKQKSSKGKMEESQEENISFLPAGVQEITVEVAKNRMGRQGEASLYFDKKFTKFRNKG